MVALRSCFVVVVVVEWENEIDCDACRVICGALAFVFVDAVLGGRENDSWFEGSFAWFYYEQCGLSDF